jgi:hypothetical protein
MANAIFVIIKAIWNPNPNFGFSSTFNFNKCGVLITILRKILETWVKDELSLLNPMEHLCF